MWIPSSFETKPAARPAPAGTELWAGDVRISTALEHDRWDEDPIRLAGDGGDGTWLSARQAGSYVLFLPAFHRWLADGWWEQGYDDLPAFLGEGAMLLDRAQYARLRRLVPGLPGATDLRPLAGWEAVRLLRFEAPAGVLGEASAPVRLRRGRVRWANWWSGDQAAEALERVLATWADSYAPVALKPIRWVDAVVSYYVARGQRSVEWQPFVVAPRHRLRLAPGYAIDEMPDLPEGSPANTLRMAAHWRPPYGSSIEILVDGEPLREGPAVDLAELARSVDSVGEYLIFTCSCGEAGCAGIRRGVDVFHHGGQVYWALYQPPRTFVFDEQAYRQAVDGIIAEFRGLCVQHPPSFKNRWQLERLALLERQQPLT
jgi:hypothetical protein